MFTYDQANIIRICITNTIIDYEKRPTQNTDTINKLYEVKHMFDTITNDLIEKENIPLSIEYLKLSGIIRYEG